MRRKLQEQPKSITWKRRVAALANATDQAYFVALRVTASPTLAEEAVQETYIWLLEHPLQDLGQDRARAYFLKAVHSRAVDLLISSRARKRREVEQAMNQPRATVLPGSAAAKGELAHAARAALEQLDRDERVAISLCCEQGLTRKVASGILGLPERTVSNQIARGLNRIKKRLVVQGFAIAAPLALAVALRELAMPAAPAALKLAVAKLTAVDVIAVGASSSVKVIAAKKVAVGAGMKLFATIGAVATIALGSGVVWVANQNSLASIAPTKTEPSPIRAVPAVPATASVSDAVLPAPKLLRPEVVLEYGFEDGIWPASLSVGKLVAGPKRAGSKFCVAGQSSPENPWSRVQFDTKKGAPLFIFEESLEIRFEYWVGEKVKSLDLYLWDESQQLSIGDIHLFNLNPEAWTVVTMSFKDWRSQKDPGARLRAGDRISQLSIQSGQKGGIYYVDNIRIRRSEQKKNGENLQPIEEF